MVTDTGQLCRLLGKIPGAGGAPVGQGREKSCRTFGLGVGRGSGLEMRAGAGEAGGGLHPQGQCGLSRACAGFCHP